MIVQDYLKPAALKAGVIKPRRRPARRYGWNRNQKIRIPTFRHSLASFLMAEGENPAVIQATLRHTRLDMTMYYSHARKAQKREAQGRVLEAVLGGERGCSGSRALFSS